MEELVALSNTNDSANVDDKMWRKKMEEKQEGMIAILNQLVSLSSAKAEKGTNSNANLFNLLGLVSIAFVFGFLACYLLLTNLH